MSESELQTLLTNPCKTFFCSGTQEILFIIIFYIVCSTSEKSAK